MLLRGGGVTAGVLALPSLLLGNGGGGGGVDVDDVLAELIGGSGGGNLRGSGWAGTAGLVPELRFALSRSPSPQLAALSPIALAMPQRPLFLGGMGGFSPFAPLSTWIFEGGGGGGGNSSSQILSTIPVRT